MEWLILMKGFTMLTVRIRASNRLTKDDILIENRDIDSERRAVKSRAVECLRVGVRTIAKTAVWNMEQIPVQKSDKDSRK